MRWRVDTRAGYASFDERDEARARELYASEGIRLVRCVDVFDERGEVVAGLPLGIGIEPRDWRPE